VFVEIINGRSNYIRYLLKKFKTKEQIPHFLFEEIERDNIIPDIQTVLKLDKIPNYLSDFIENWSKNDSLIAYIPIHLPFQIKLKEVEAFIGGEIEDESQKRKLKHFLDNENAEVKTHIDDNESVWETYEPTLARHLSESTITYYDRVIDCKIITSQIESIIELLNNQN
jgi:macrodomain Ter protein organizer (MatP/YcbG family)